MTKNSHLHDIIKELEALQDQRADALSDFNIVLAEARDKHGYEPKLLRKVLRRRADISRRGGATVAEEEAALQALFDELAQK